MDKLNLDTWIISDTHFFHDNIVKYCDRPIDHTEIMVKNWHAMIEPEDTVLHLGDIFMGKRAQTIPLLNKLPGDIWFIRGNHDKQGIHWYNTAGFRHVGWVQKGWGKILNAAEFTTAEGKRVLFTHYPDTTHTDQWDINIHGHIHNNGYSPSTPDLDYRNVSVEVMDYKPVRLRDVLYGDSYQARKDAPEWALQTAEVRNGIAIPTDKQVGYYEKSD